MIGSALFSFAAGSLVEAVGPGRRLPAVSTGTRGLRLGAMLAFHDGGRDTR